MAMNPNPVYQSNLTASAVAYITAGTNENLGISKISLTNNNTTTVRNVTIYIETGGGAATTPILNTYAIPPYGVVTPPLAAHVVGAGAKLYAKQDAGTDVQIFITTDRRPF